MFDVLPRFIVPALRLLRDLRASAVISDLFPSTASPRNVSFTPPCPSTTLAHMSALAEIELFHFLPIQNKFWFFPPVP